MLAMSQNERIARTSASVRLRRMQNNLRGQLLRLVDDLEDDSVKSNLHEVIANLEDGLLPAALTYMRELRRMFEEMRESAR